MMTYADPASIVTDHALVRWLERVCGFPMEHYRSQLATTIGPIAEAGTTTYVATEGVYVFEGRRLITVVEPAMFERSQIGRMRRAATGS